MASTAASPTATQPINNHGSTTRTVGTPPAPTEAAGQPAPVAEAVNWALVVAIAGFIVNLGFNSLNFWRAGRFRQREARKTAFDTAVASRLRTAQQGLDDVLTAVRANQVAEAQTLSPRGGAKARVAAIKKIQDEKVNQAIAAMEIAINGAIDHPFGGSENWRALEDRTDQIFECFNDLLDTSATPAVIARAYKGVSTTITTLNGEITAMLDREVSRLLGIRIKRP